MQFLAGPTKPESLGHILSKAMAEMINRRPPKL
jgi:hypothetical protein